MFNLITSYYETSTEERQQELKQCLIHNAKNPHIKKIYLLNPAIFNLDFVEEEYKPKIVQHLVNDENRNRLYFDFAVKFINENTVDENCILSNSDIYFDDTLRFLENYDFTKNVFVLAKYDNDLISSGATCSQDSWMFKSPLNIDLSKLKFQFGVPGCDNIFAGLMHLHGYKVYNPALSIKSHHLHASNYRNYSEANRIHGYYGFVNATSLETLHKTEFHGHYQ